MCDSTTKPIYDARDFVDDDDYDIFDMTLIQSSTLSSTSCK